MAASSLKGTYAHMCIRVCGKGLGINNMIRSPQQHCIRKPLPHTRIRLCLCLLKRAPPHGSDAALVFSERTFCKHSCYHQDSLRKILVFLLHHSDSLLTKLDLVMQWRHAPVCLVRFLLLLSASSEGCTSSFFLFLYQTLPAYLPTRS